MADGFLGRWARRKQEVREGRPVEEPVRPSPQPSPASGRGGDTATSIQPMSSLGQPEESREGGAHPLPPAGEGRGEGAVNTPPPPTLQDVRALTPQSDFTPFMARDVDPEVKNAAMKKLFADPHFNVMDGLDIYIDDYSKPDPLPQSVLRQMASAKFLNLFDDEKKETTALPDDVAAPVSLPAAPATPAAPAVAPESPGLKTEDHDHTDLRLQQDHAAGPQGPGRGPQ